MDSANYRYLSQRQNIQYVLVTECIMSASLIINQHIIKGSLRFFRPMCLVFLIYFLEPKTIFVTFTCQHFLPRCRCYGTHNCEAWGKSYCRKSSTRLTKKIKNIVKALVKNHYGDDFLFWKILIWKPSLYRNSGMKSSIERNSDDWLAHR